MASPFLDLESVAFIAITRGNSNPLHSMTSGLKHHFILPLARLMIITLTQSLKVPFVPSTYWQQPLLSKQGLPPDSGPKPLGMRLIFIIHHLRLPLVLLQLILTSAPTNDSPLSNLKSWIYALLAPARSYLSRHNTSLKVAFLPEVGSAFPRPMHRLSGLLGGLGS